MGPFRGKVQTVLGCIDPSQLGIVLPHEHLSSDFTCAFTPPQPEDEHRIELQPSLENMGWVLRYPYSNKPNMIFNDDATHSAILEETMSFKRLGGGTMVENTTADMLRNVKFMKKVSEETGVHIVAGTGYYLESVHPKAMDTLKVEDIVETMKNDFMVGCDGTDIKCGVIGEIGCSWPLHVNEKKCLLATGEAQSQLGCPVIIHPGRHSQSPAEVLRILQEAGGNTDKTVMSHLDRTFHNDEELLEFAELGCYLEYDHFGIEIADWQCDPTIDMPNDGERIRRIKRLFASGYTKVVIAHDMHAKHMLQRYGGHGLTHILKNVLPQMRRRGITEEQIDNMLAKNPREWLTMM